MWRCARSIYENHIILCPDLYISRDDVICIDNITYDITGITDDYDVYLQDRNNRNLHKYPASAFVQMLKNNDFTYIRNLHQECIDRNKKQSYFYN